MMSIPAFLNGFAMRFKIDYGLDLPLIDSSYFHQHCFANLACLIYRVRVLMMYLQSASSNLRASFSPFLLLS